MLWLGTLILTPSLLPWRANEVGVKLLVGMVRNFTVSLLVSSEKMRVCLMVTGHRRMEIGLGEMMNWKWWWREELVDWGWRKRMT